MALTEHIEDTALGSDAELAGRIAAGDKEAEGELFERYGSLIASQVQLKLGNVADWQDVASEVSMAVLLSLRDGKFDPAKSSSLGSYIYGILRYKVLDFHRNGKNRPLALDNLPEAVMPAEQRESEREKHERSAMLKRAIEKLKPKYKEVLYLRYYKEYTIQEIADELGMPTRRISERIHYAVKLLKKKTKGTHFFSIISLLI